jgi:hypothetical protein
VKEEFMSTEEKFDGMFLSIAQQSQVLLVMLAV